ncbi:MAG: hypothetical protein V1717_02785 [Candidatus Micrarchaeota archaeon]
MFEVIGIAGAFLVVIAWIFEVRQIMARHHSPLDWNFGLLYFAGSVFLVAYALAINAGVFAFLNLMAALLALVGLYYKWMEKRKKENAVNMAKKTGRKRRRK